MKEKVLFRLAELKDKYKSCGSEIPAGLDTMKKY